MNVHFDGFTEDGLAFLNKSQAAELDGAAVEAGDVLLNITGASIGRVAQAPDRLAGARVNQHVCIIRPNGALNPSFLRYYLSSPSVQQFIMREEYGVTRQALTKGQILDFVIPLPPLPEQQRIVAKVEALLARVNAARARPAKAPAILKRFRQSVLAAASSGRLTAEWRETNPNIEPASALFERVIAVREKASGSHKRIAAYSDSAELDAHYELPETWDWVRLGSIVSNRDALRVPVKQEDRDRRDGPYPYYGAFGVIDQIDEYLFDGEYLLVAEDGKNLESRLRPIALRANGKFWVNNHAHVLQPLCGISVPYLELCLNSPSLDLVPFLTGIDQVKLNREALDRLPIPLPPLSEQCEIVSRTALLLKCASETETRLASATARAEKITQTILDKAFRGDLVPTEADLARREGRTYEPASALLARINEQKATPAPTTHRRRAAAKAP